MIWIILGAGPWALLIVTFLVLWVRVDPWVVFVTAIVLGILSASAFSIVYGLSQLGLIHERVLGGI